jgi:hypothetical protein
MNLQMDTRRWFHLGYLAVLISYAAEQRNPLCTKVAGE